jgi:hypothetical protein
MMRYLKQPLIQALLSFSLFIALVQWRAGQPVMPTPTIPLDRVVLSAPVLTALYGGDRFLAADLETVRLSATGTEGGQPDANYLVRAHEVVSELNPCHEDNYYLANALLTWGGAVDEGDKVLQRAIDCRSWDELPPFFYGFNQYFFNHNIKEAQRALGVAADRATGNAASFRKFAIMIGIEQIEDEKLALKMLEQERDKARGAKLIAMLDKRVKRLEGLVILRDAQRAYEKKTGKPLKRPQDLVTEGILDALPQDPMKIGYEFVDGRFILKQIKI